MTSNASYQVTWLSRAIASIVLVGGLSWGLLSSSGCADLSRGACAVDAGQSSLDDAGQSDAGANADGAGGDPLSFASAIHPLLMTSCKSCHSSGGQAGDTQLLFVGSAATDFTSVSKFVDPLAPSGSRLLSKLGGNGHGGGTVFASGSPEYQTILRWIQQGARP